MTIETQAPLLVSIKEAAKMIGVSRNQFIIMLEEGSFEDVRIGRRRLIVPESVEAYVNNLRGKQ